MSIIRRNAGHSSRSLILPPTQPDGLATSSASRLAQPQQAAIRKPGYRLTSPTNRPQRSARHIHSQPDHRSHSRCQRAGQSVSHTHRYKACNKFDSRLKLSKQAQNQDPRSRSGLHKIRQATLPTSRTEGSPHTTFTITQRGNEATSCGISDAAPSDSSPHCPKPLPLRQPPAPPCLTSYLQHLPP